MSSNLLRKKKFDETYLVVLFANSSTSSHQRYNLANGIDGSIDGTQTVVEVFLLLLFVIQEALFAQTTAVVANHVARASGFTAAKVLAV